MDTATNTNGSVTPWNKGKLLGQKPPLKLKEIWGHPDSAAIGSSSPRTCIVQPRHRQQVAGCDLVALRVHDVAQGSRHLRSSLHCST